MGKAHVPGNECQASREQADASAWERECVRVSGSPAPCRGLPSLTTGPLWRTLCVAALAVVKGVK